MIENPEPIQWAYDLDDIQEIHEGLATIEATRAIAEELRLLTKYVVLFVETNVVVEGELLSRARPEIVHAIPESTVANLLEALGHVRDVLDCKGDVVPGQALPIDTRERLFSVEALLSAELGEPVWEGRRT